MAPKKGNRKQKAQSSEDGAFSDKNRKAIPVSRLSESEDEPSSEEEAPKTRRAERFKGFTDLPSSSSQESASDSDSDDEAKASVSESSESESENIIESKLEIKKQPQQAAATLKAKGKAKAKPAVRVSIPSLL